MCKDFNHVQMRWFLPLPPIIMSISLRLKSVSALILFRIIFLAAATFFVLPFLVSISIGIPVSNDINVMISCAFRNIFSPPAHYSNTLSGTLSILKRCRDGAINVLYPPKMVLTAPFKEPLFHHQRTSCTDLCTSSPSAAADAPHADAQ